MKKIDIIATDLDGTLLTDNKQISDGNRRALEKAASEGIYIVPATGRALYKICGNVKRCGYREYENRRNTLQKPDGLFDCRKNNKIRT